MFFFFNLVNWGSIKNEKVEKSTESEYNEKNSYSINEHTANVLSYYSKVKKLCKGTETYGQGVYSLG